MTQFLGIIIAAALVNNVVLIQLLGVSSFFAYSNVLRNAIELAWISGLVMCLSTVTNLLVAHWILTPLNLNFLQLILFVVICAAYTRGAIALLARHWTQSLRRLGTEFLLISGNSAVVGISLLNASSIRSLTDSITYSLGAALGFGFFLVMFAALRQRLDTSAIPHAFRGPPIQLISAGIIAMCLLGFAGIV